MKSTLIKYVNQVQYEDYIVHYHVNGDVKFPDEFPSALPETISRINDKIEAILNVPDPKEAKEWENVDNFASQASGITAIKDAIRKTEQYIAKWGERRPKDNHLAQAETLLDKLRKDLTKAEIGELEDEWLKVNKFDYNAIISFLRRHPGNPFLGEADEYLWDITRSSRPLKKSEIRRYISDAKLFGLSHLSEAEDMIGQIDTWGDIKKAASWREVLEFVRQHSESGFADEAQELLEELVEREMDKMRKNPARYSAYDCLDLVNSDLIDKYSLMGEHLVTEDSFDRMMTISEFREEHPIPNPKGNYFDDAENENITDIFLFGIPATGKTSILMGLLQSGKFKFNSVIADGEYGEILQNYVEEGLMPPQTLENFVAICTGYVLDKKGLKHPVNIIDMAGEDFALQIARNPNGDISFADMGHNAARLLDSKHRKIFFVVIDPTEDKVILTRPVYKYDADGNPIDIITYKKIPIYQNQTLNRLVNLFSEPINSEIMKKVDGIHFVMTKADMLDPDGMGQDYKKSEGKKRLMHSLYRSQVEHVQGLCDKSQLDLPAPDLFMFSLGKFYVGNVFEFDPSDADVILDMVAGNSLGIHKNSSWDKIVSFLSKPIF